MAEILLNPHHLEFFREFLKERNADSPLVFLVAVQKLSLETNEKIYEAALEHVIKTFFHGKLPPGMHPFLLIPFSSPFSF
jgi:hypothetical protein